MSDHFHPDKTQRHDNFHLRLLITKRGKRNAFAPKAQRHQLIIQCGITPFWFNQTGAIVDKNNFNRE
ncbi:hypothetical protein [Pantoea latae]|uniref:Uncharacterized protein n=1 Tax=Pantoea latae TaxID=1964541 RepID=A0A1V9DJX6_9GAMM|nr:hypothetical protein [Pantoea latae]OQP34064.1 hypothetical protein B2J69_09775 [Pantoea latae]